MVRSSFAVTRLVLLPYGALLALYLVVVGGGGAWLYIETRAVQTRLLVDEIISAVEPVTEALGGFGVAGEAGLPDSPMVRRIEGLFAELPALRHVSLRGRSGGLVLRGGADGGVTTRRAAPLPAGAVLQPGLTAPGRRLLEERGPAFVMGFDVAAGTSERLRLGLSFDRAMLLSRIDTALAPIRHAVALFVTVGGGSILVALGITAVAMRTTQRIEAHFQELYRRVALSRLAAELVHDLRNPLMALRANIRAIVASPDQAEVIADEMDRDVVALNDKLSGFLNLTRDRGDPFVPVDVVALLHDAVRLARPALERHGLDARVEAAPRLGVVEAQKGPLRDALVNVIVNAAESGQEDGEVEVAARTERKTLIITVEDRGRGIAEDDQTRLFEPFWTTRAEGNGLGLAIVWRVMAAHDGSVSAENREGGGARVTLTLPLKRQEVPQWWQVLNAGSPT